MSRTKQPHFMHFGPEIPVVPMGNFSRMGLTEKQWADAWHLCGPSAARNMQRLQLWQVIASAYLEGLQHGAEMMKERPDVGRDQELPAVAAVSHHNLDDSFGG